MGLHFIFGFYFRTLYLILFCFYDFFMTLQVRNKVIQIFMITSAAIILTAFLTFFIALFTRQIIIPPANRIPVFLDKLFIFKYSFTANMIGIVLICSYSILTAFHVLKFFEATQTSEVIYFIGFMAACLCEITRFFMPLFGLWSSLSSLLFFLGRILFAARIIAPLSFVFAAIASSTEMRQDVERNMTFLIGIGVVFSVIVPLNASRISTTGVIAWGFPALFFALRLLFTIISCTSFLISGYKQGSKDYQKLALDSFLVITGYGILTSADNFLFLAAGTPLLIYGTARFLKDLHKAYL